MPLPRLPTIRLLLTLIALLGGVAVRSQACTPRRHDGSPVAPIAASAPGTPDLMPSPAREPLDAAEAMARARRRHRGEPVGRVVQALSRCVFDPEMHDAAGGDTTPAQRCEWSGAAAHVPAERTNRVLQERTPRVATFGMDGPRLVPLLLFD